MTNSTTDRERVCATRDWRAHRRVSQTVKTDGRQLACLYETNPVAAQIVGRQWCAINIPDIGYA